MEEIFKNLSVKKANLLILILESQNIDSVSVKTDYGFSLLVTEEDKSKALSAIETYFRENRFLSFRNQIQKIPVSSFKSMTAVTIMLILWAIHLGGIHFGLHLEWISKFGSSALYILQGEVFRTITALFLHADGQHLIGNMGGMLIFGAPLITLTGYGTGTLLLLISGAAGNYLNALFYKTAHLSIGASTAVMGAAGALAAFQMTRKDKAFKIKSLFPLAAGATLVGMFSQGEKTDVSAHIFGFLAGLLAGLIFFVVSAKYKQPENQFSYMIIVLFIVVFAFFKGY
ncbi:MAG: rhomboid family intramembrane serine protease [Desulfobacteraceae bacterium]|nr:rhomboid family intramembrane serine protease [Desulfobacteraceae bacterium]